MAENESIDGATTALHRRIEELTEESIEAHRLLELERAKDGDVWKERALTERAARKVAEKEAAQYKLWLDETSKSHDATNAHLEQAEHERDTALARAKELENDLEIANQHFRARVAELEAAETALASARSVIEEAYHYQNRMPTDFVLRARSWLTSHPAPVAAPRSESRCALSINGQHDWYCKLCMPAPVAVLPPISESDSGL